MSEEQHRADFEAGNILESIKPGTDGIASLVALIDDEVIARKEGVMTDALPAMHSRRWVYRDKDGNIQEHEVQPPELSISVRSLDSFVRIFNAMTMAQVQDEDGKMVPVPVTNGLIRIVRPAMDNLHEERAYLIGYPNREARYDKIMVELVPTASMSVLSHWHKAWSEAPGADGVPQLSFVSTLDFVFAGEVDISSEFVSLCRNAKSVARTHDTRASGSRSMGNDVEVETANVSNLPDLVDIGQVSVFRNVPEARPGVLRCRFFADTNGTPSFICKPEGGSYRSLIDKAYESIHAHIIKNVDPSVVVVM